MDLDFGFVGSFESDSEAVVVSAGFDEENQLLNHPPLLSLALALAILQHGPNFSLKIILYDYQQV